MNHEVGFTTLKDMVIEQCSCFSSRCGHTLGFYARNYRKVVNLLFPKSSSWLGFANERRFCDGGVHVGCWHTGGWKARCGTYRFGRSGCIERPRRVRLLRIPFLSPVAFILRIHCARVLEEVTVNSAASGVTVSGDGRPRVAVNVAGTEGFLQRAFVLFL